MKNRLKNIALTIIGWIFLLSIPHILILIYAVTFAPHELPPHEPPKDPGAMMFLALFLFNAFLVTFYYLNSFVLIPRFLSKKKVSAYISSIVGLMVFYLALPILIKFLFPRHDLSDNVQNHKQLFVVHILLSTLIFAGIFIVSTSIRITKEWYGAEEKSEQVSLEKTVAELAFLKAQINPHFLFNSLNSIYSLSLRRSERAPEAILLLSDMMRYLLSEAQMEYVPLDSEIGYIMKYIELQKLRLTKNAVIDFVVTGDSEEYLIAPLLLIPFIENAFKFGISTAEESPIIIHIDQKESTLKMIVVNKVFSDINEVIKSSGIGLVNIKKRLDLIYAGKYRLSIDPNQNGSYFIDLELSL